ncbi:MAG: calcium-binding protein, partial [Planctomycetaceae bacterium]
FNTVQFLVPESSAGGSVAARFRISTAGGLAPTGRAADGEVEDHVATIVGPGFIGVVADPNDPAKTALFVFGTNFGDLIEMSQNAAGSVQVRMNGLNRGVFAPTGGTYVFGLNGHDAIRFDNRFTTGAMVFGGGGNDTVTGGAGNDVISGGEGNDSLNGGWNGFDILFGGRGGDSLSGHDDGNTLFGGNGDLLLAGHSSYDNDLLALHKLRLAWGNGTSTSSRVNAIFNGQNGAPALNSSTAFNDVAVDELFGSFSRGEDWFLYDLNDSNNAANGDFTTLL